MMTNGHTFIDHICKVLFTAETKRLAKTISDLIDKNQALYFVYLHGFTHAGEGFNREGLTGALQRKTLHIKLWDEMNLFLADRKHIENDKKDIQQLLFKLLDPCFSSQDIRDSIPDCVLDTLPSYIRDLQRARNPTFFLNHERDFRQYNKTLPKLEFYSAARLLY